MEELESVERCPICGNADARLIHTGLRDYTFGAALGSWRLYVCKDCGCGYLNPRPRPASINKAYGTYYTHALRRASTFTVRFREAVSNGMHNALLGTTLEPALGLGRLLAVFWRSRRELVEHDGRFLGTHAPRPGCLLDIGCGNGRFLRLAKSAGWRAWGLEPDPNAAAVARQFADHLIVGGYDAAGSMPGHFDVVTVSHVLEHVYDPHEFLDVCHTALRPEGMLWVEVPNFAGCGAETWGMDWRGLEPPRHLVHFTVQGLRDLLTEHGFRIVRQATTPRRLVRWMFRESYEIALRRTHDEGIGNQDKMLRHLRQADHCAKAAEKNPGKSEFITFLARKDLAPARTKGR